MGEERLEAFFRDDLGALSLILDSIPLGIIVADATGTCLYLNHECTSITGYTLEDVRADLNDLARHLPLHCSRNADPGGAARPVESDGHG